MTSSSRHSDRLIEQIEQLKTQDGVQRLARFLASLCPVRVGACLITLPYDKASLAGYLGLAPETLSRDFAKLKSIGIEVRGSRVAVSEAGKLHRLAAEDRSAPDEIAKPVARTISCPKLTCCCAIGGGKR